MPCDVATSLRLKLARPNLSKPVLSKSKLAPQPPQFTSLKYLNDLCFNKFYVDWRLIVCSINATIFDAVY